MKGLKLTINSDSSFELQLGTSIYYARNIRELSELLSFVANHFEMFLPLL